MPIELTLLAWASILGLVHLLVTVPFTVGHHGLSYVLSARDPQVPLEGKSARLDRAFHNFLQTFPFFAVAVLGVTLVGRHSGQTVLGAEIYLAARIFYIPTYVLGTAVLRTLIWLLSVVGIGLILAALL